jgi:hypothetical protein
MEHGRFSLMYLHKHLHIIMFVLQPFWLHKTHVHLVSFYPVKSCIEMFMHEKLSFSVKVFRFLTLVHK